MVLRPPPALPAPQWLSAGALALVAGLLLSGAGWILGHRILPVIGLAMALAGGLWLWRQGMRLGLEGEENARRPLERGRAGV